MRSLAKFLTGVVLTFGAVSAVSLGSAMAGGSFHPSAVAAFLQGASSLTGRGGHVSFLADGQNVAANQPGVIMLHFKVDPGFHINSHTPKSDMLIPTKLLVEDLNGAAVSAVDFPQGTPYSFAFEPKTKLDVYSGDVALTAHVKAKPGSYVLKGALHYQACDQTACYPPKTLALEQPFTAR
ncbi:MAG: protein-disulfide reductase DsbD N-terminal domain-containing protein [Janthinobacterium lividum]